MTSSLLNNLNLLVSNQDFLEEEVVEENNNNHQENFRHFSKNYRSLSPPNSLWLPHATTHTATHSSSAAAAGAGGGSSNSGHPHQLTSDSSTNHQLSSSLLTNQISGLLSSLGAYNGDNPYSNSLLIAADPCNFSAVVNNENSAANNSLQKLTQPHPQHSSYLRRLRLQNLLHTVPPSSTAAAGVASTPSSLDRPLPPASPPSLPPPSPGPSDPLQDSLLVPPSLPQLLPQPGPHYGVEDRSLGQQDLIHLNETTNSEADDILELLSESCSLPTVLQQEPLSEDLPMRHHSTSLYHSATSTTGHQPPSSAAAAASRSSSFLFTPNPADLLFNNQQHHRPTFTRSQSVPEQPHHGSYLDSADEELLLEAAAATLDDPLPITPSVFINEHNYRPSSRLQYLPVAPSVPASHLPASAGQFYPSVINRTSRISLSSSELPTSRRSAAAQDRLSLLQAELQEAAASSRRLTSAAGHKRRTTRTSPPLTLGRSLQLVTENADRAQSTRLQHTNALAALLKNRAAKGVRFESEEWRLHHAHLLNDPSLFPSGLGFDADAWMSVEDVRSGRWARWDALVKQESQETRDSGIETGSCFTSSEDSNRGSATDHHHLHHHYYHKKVAVLTPMPSLQDQNTHIFEKFTPKIFLFVILDEFHTFCILQHCR